MLGLKCGAFGMLSIGLTTNAMALSFGGAEPGHSTLLQNLPKQYWTSSLPSPHSNKWEPLSRRQIRCLLKFPQVAPASSATAKCAQWLQDRIFGYYSYVATAPPSASKNAWLWRLPLLRREKERNIPMCKPLKSLCTEAVHEAQPVTILSACSTAWAPTENSRKQSPTGVLVRGTLGLPAPLPNSSWGGRNPKRLIKIMAF